MENALGTEQDVRVGERIKLLNGPVKSTASTEQEYEIQPACEDKRNGHWACATHIRGCPHMAMDQHAPSGEDCRLVWVCHEHGPEIP